MNQICVHCLKIIEGDGVVCKKCAINYDKQCAASIKNCFNCNQYLTTSSSSSSSTTQCATTTINNIETGTPSSSSSSECATTTINNIDLNKNDEQTLGIKNEGVQNDKNDKNDLNKNDEQTLRIKNEGVQNDKNNKNDQQTLRIKNEAVQIVCTGYQVNKCQNGAKCKFSHNSNIQNN